MERSKDTLGPKLGSLVNQASKSMTKVNLLVDDLLNASRLGEAQLHLRKTRFNLSKAIDECCLHVTEGGIYTIITEGAKDAEVEADSERIQRVIVNFVNNAIKYAPQSKEIKNSHNTGSGASQSIGYRPGARYSGREAGLSV